MTRNVQSELKEIIQGNSVILFMKGNREMPQCGFSSRVVEILNSFDAEYATVDILSDPEVRQGIKVYSNWPTLPQLYIKGEFVGGCDIITDMHLNGQLETMLSAG
ncbi:MAG: Grx4 family monothiol glutaredoxin [Myxococcota bacterium]|nr:Grx4 family monothiol glutaredoxin [Myxococcota bacterium]